MNWLSLKWTQDHVEGLLILATLDGESSLGDLYQSLQVEDRIGDVGEDNLTLVDLVHEEFFHLL